MACYVTWQPDPGAAYIDTFLLDWSMVKTVYISSSTHTQIPGIGRHDRCVPGVEGQYWFPKLSAMIVERLELPAEGLLLPSPHQVVDSRFRLCSGKIQSKLT